MKEEREGKDLDIRPLLPSSTRTEVATPTMLGQLIRGLKPAQCFPAPEAWFNRTLDILSTFSHA